MLLTDPLTVEPIEAAEDRATQNVLPGPFAGENYIAGNDSAFDLIGE